MEFNSFSHQFAVILESFSIHIIYLFCYNSNLRYSIYLTRVKRRIKRRTEKKNPPVGKNSSYVIFFFTQKDCCLLKSRYIKVIYTVVQLQSDLFTGKNFNAI